MGKSFSDSLRDMLVQFARMMGREVREGQVDLKLDYRWYILIGLFVMCLGGIVLCFVKLKSMVVILGILLLGVFGFVALVRSRSAGEDGKGSSV